MKILSLTISTLLLISCGEESANSIASVEALATNPSTEESKETKKDVAPEVFETMVDASSEPTSRAYLTLDEAPDCSEDLKANLIYISSTDTFRHCDGVNWVTIDMEPEPEVEEPVTLVSHVECYYLNADHDTPFFAYYYDLKKYSNGSVFIDLNVIEAYTETHRQYDSVQAYHALDNDDASQGKIFWRDYNGPNTFYMDTASSFVMEFYESGSKVTKQWNLSDCE